MSQEERSTMAARHRVAGTLPLQEQPPPPWSTTMQAKREVKHEEVEVLEQRLWGVSNQCFAEVSWPPL